MNTVTIEAPPLVRSRPARQTTAPVPTPATSKPTQLLPIFTMVLWLGCLCIGLLGFAFPYSMPQPIPNVPPVTVEVLNVELSHEPFPEVAPPPSSLLTPPPPEELVQPRIPQPVVVAEPSPAVAFAVSVEGPAQVVEDAAAAHNRADAVTTTAVSAPAPRALTFGQGEGKQPAPDYPRQAIREGQEGTVVVQLTVGPNGRVVAAEASTPSPWPLLDESALRTIRSRWRFSPGDLRAYEVAIRFQLDKSK